MPDFRVTIEVKNVARGDVHDLCQEILDRHGDAFDAGHGEFVVRTAERPGQSGENYFPYDWEEEAE